ncbi:MAG TPA: SMP-30/gluconolactonase/LRE family protein [Gemmatimonadaceae bacterium]|nr:SMP-30/gluconolactonase/LRE family protein [Gemmatimonadaceae bacterium]
MLGTHAPGAPGFHDRLTHSSTARLLLAAAPLLALAIGSGNVTAQPTATRLDSTHRVATVTGLEGPEAVKYDSIQDVYFIANFGPRAAASRDSNGYIARVRPDGTVETLKFMTGTAAAPLHQPRGMAITGDTLWVADADGVHGFLRRTGAHAAFVDFTAHQPGFLNDIAVGPDGRLYITDTGLGRVYRITRGAAEIAVEDSMTGPPNGITWDASGSRFILAPWGDARTLRAWDPATGTLTELDSMPGGRHDGIEMLNGGMVVTSQRDSTIYFVLGGRPHPVIRTPGAPADIGIDTRRGRIAVPYIALNRVDIWDLREVTVPLRR